MSLIPNVLFEDDYIRVIHRPGSSAFSLITFSNYGYNHQLGKFWAQSFAEAEDLNTYGFVAKGNNWFPTRSMNAALDQGKFDRSRPIVTYGHSLGGYAALKYSRALGASSVIAGAPQFSINPEALPKDRRFTHEFNAVIHDQMEITGCDICGNVVIVVDPYDEMDALHLALIEQAANSERTKILPVHHIGHNVMDVLADRDIILTLLSLSLSGKSLLASLAKVRAAKKRSLSYSYNLATKLLAKHRPTAAKMVLEQVEKRSGLRAAPSLIARHLFVASKVSVALNESNDALKYAFEAQSRSLNDPRFALWVAICLAHAGQWTEAKSKIESFLQVPNSAILSDMANDILADLEVKLIPSVDLYI